MATDKTVIVLPNLKSVQLVPNTAQAFGGIVYNEGIYISRDSTKKTYPKSVARIYKNPNRPKTIYLLSKDTSFKQAVAKRYETSESESSEIVKWPSLEEYVISDTQTLSKYSNFSQPSNITSLNFDDSSLINKTINFYVLDPVIYSNIFNNLKGQEISQTIEQDYLTVNGLVFYSSQELEEFSNLNSVIYSYFLKSKSIIADNQNEEETYTDKQIELFNGSLYNYWFDSSKSTNISYLTENDLKLLTTTKVKNAQSLDFSQYIDIKYENVWIQKIDNNINSAGSYSVNNSYVLSNYEVEKTAGSFNGLIDASILETFKNKTLFISKNDLYLKENYKNRQLFKIKSKVDDDDGFADFLTNQNGINARKSGAIIQNNRNVFEYEYTINFSKEESPIIYDSSDTQRQKQIEDLTTDDLSSLYVMNDLYEEQRNKFGFIPDDPTTTVYELQLNDELQFENGSFVVVEIE
jgi:hypothetical protein